MNERIKELLVQAMTEVGPDDTDLKTLEKFAELLILEHIAVIKRVGILEDIENETDMVVDAVKEHFGVE